MPVCQYPNRSMYKIVYFPSSSDILRYELTPRRTVWRAKTGMFSCSLSISPKCVVVEVAIALLRQGQHSLAQIVFKPIGGGPAAIAVGQGRQPGGRLAFEAFGVAIAHPQRRRSCGEAHRSLQHLRQQLVAFHLPSSDCDGVVHGAIIGPVSSPPAPTRRGHCVLSRRPGSGSGPGSGPGPALPYLSPILTPRGDIFPL